VTPAVTVLVPTHNRADVLPFAIRSVLAQTLSDFELFVVGDGCTDESAAAVAAFDDSRIRWFDLPKAPYFGYANRNRALRQARGDVVAYLGHDDLWFPDHLALLVGLIQEQDGDFATSRRLLVARDGTIRQHLLNLDDPEMVERVMRGRDSFGPTAVVHRRDCLERYGYWREDLPRAADWELWTRILRGNGRRLAYCDTPTSFHFVPDRRSERRQTTILDRLRRWDRALPAELSVHVPPGATEQEAFWHAISSDPAGFAAKVRRAVRVDIDRRARMEYPSSLAFIVYRQWSRFVSRRPTDPTRVSEGKRGAKG
jgi:glycosyltransferase involved in cell wall biosynthesis